ncbi:MAG: cyclic nucleotide-binding domain-containing protein [Burkholderiaceae bacterium]|jgi:CRP-like cAMP-binding protein|nr:cyclic nucleotide-binding domain-containing protein [Burkholderiaceae bacterium]
MSEVLPNRPSHDLQGLIDAIAAGGSYDQIPLRLDAGQWDVLAGYLRPRAAKAGEVLIRQGALDRALYFLASGTLTVHLQGVNGQMRLVVLAPGTAVGEGAFFSGAPRTATVVATRDSQLWCLSYEDFCTLAEQRSDVALQIALACAAVSVQRMTNNSMRLAVT